MHTLLGKIMKYVLRVLLVFILSLLLIGLVKFRGNVDAYFHFLNTRDWKQARAGLKISEPATFGNMFRGTGKTDTMTGIVIFTGDVTTSGTSAATGLDAYDPSMEADLTATNSTNNSGTFGFTKTDTTATQTTKPNTSGEAADSAKAQLLNLIKQREANK
ncbi:MAG: hypothetical protein NTX91_02785 [candidate division SR1 bacterium]|nr:hypothetical protein [candidate division SR1 bacterium]